MRHHSLVGSNFSFMFLTKVFHPFFNSSLLGVLKGSARQDLLGSSGAWPHSDRWVPPPSVSESRHIRVGTEFSLLTSFQVPLTMLVGAGGGRGLKAPF